MYAYIEMSTAYTTVIDNPYTLNYYKGQVAFITGPTNVDTTTPVNSVTISSNLEIC